MRTYKIWDVDMVRSGIRFLLFFLILIISTGLYGKDKNKKQYRGVATEEKFIENIINKEITKLNNDYYSSDNKNKDEKANPKDKMEQDLSTPFSTKHIPKKQKENKKVDINKILKNDGTHFLKDYDKNSTWGIFNSVQSELPSISVKDLKESNNPVQVSINNNNPGQGEMVKIHISSPKQIIKCFGNVSGKKIYFLTDRKNHSFNGYAGFDIQEAPGNRTILIAVLFQDKSIKYLKKTISLKRKVVTRKIRIPYYKWKKVKRTYRKWVRIKGKKVRRKYTKWVKVKKRYYKYISPPTINSKAGKKSLAQFQKELENTLTEVPLGSDGDEDEYDIMPFTIVESNEKNKEKAEQAKGYSIFSHQYKVKTPIQFWSGPFIQPTYPGKRVKVSSFGKYRVFRFRGRVRRGYHKGLDIAKPTGTPLHSPNHGIVVIAGKYGGRGNAVVIDHGGGIYTVQYHLSKILVEKGMFVRKGQVIGKVGSTGFSTGPHLHWEMRVHGVSVNTFDMRSPE